MGITANFGYTIETDVLESPVINGACFSVHRVNINLGYSEIQADGFES